MKNAIIAQGGGPSAVINASLAGVISGLQKNSEVDHIYGAVGGIEGLLNEKFFDLKDLSSDDLEALKRTPASGMGSCRYKLKEEDYPRLLEVLEKFDCKYFFYNGGNDSMDTCLKVSQQAVGINVIGVPKTIDNDLPFTDHTPGFGSAAKYAAVATAEIGLDIRSLPLHVTFLELMGRNAGWLTAASALAKDMGGMAPHLIYLPERPVSIDRILDDVQKTQAEYGKGIVVAVSEGLLDETGEVHGSKESVDALDAFGHKIAGGVGQYLEQTVRSRLGSRARSEKPGILQRASKLHVSEVDREEAFLSGTECAKAALDGISGYMIGFERVPGSDYEIKYKRIELDKVANVEHFMPNEYINKEGNGVTEAFLDYARPLIGKELPCYFRIPYDV